jgi:4-carboxymuconolactone decarboxylase
MPASTTRTRLEPLTPPYEPELARTLERMMPPGIEPLKLFRTVAHNPAILDKFRSTGAYILNFGTVDPRDREIVIHRTCARCRCEYEWGVHAVAFARSLGLTDDQIEATVTGRADDPAWSERDSLLVQLADELHDEATVSDALWRSLAGEWRPEQLVELIATTGFYHLVSFMANATGVALEDTAARFPR